jgi:glyoxylase-like metal-dependent hydrolase (beta-lactamase superfamily II)
MNTYALICPETKESVLIDPGADPDELEAMLAGSEPRAIVLTHDHMDHVGALEEMLARLEVPLLAHPGEPAGDTRPPADRWLEEGDTLTIGNATLHVEYAPGHIGNQICLVLDDDHRVIVGDTIFAGGPGKTWSPGQFQQTLETLRDVVLAWPDDTVCYPGHGPSFRLGDIRAEVEAFLEKDHGDFYGDAEWGM